MIKVYFKINKSLVFGGQGVKTQKLQIYDVIENFQIQSFGNPNTLIYCPVHCGHDDIIFAALLSVDSESRAFKNSPAASPSKIARGYISGTVDLTSLTLSESFSGHKRTPYAKF